MEYLDSVQLDGIQGYLSKRAFRVTNLGLGRRASACPKGKQP